MNQLLCGFFPGGRIGILMTEGLFKQFDQKTLTHMAYNFLKTGIEEKEYFDSKGKLDFVFTRLKRPKKPKKLQKTKEPS